MGEAVSVADGARVTIGDGTADGALERTELGSRVGLTVGPPDGLADGTAVGTDDGAKLGLQVG